MAALCSADYGLWVACVRDTDFKEGKIPNWSPEGVFQNLFLKCSLVSFQSLFGMNWGEAGLRAYSVKSWLSERAEGSPWTRIPGKSLRFYHSRPRGKRTNSNLGVREQKCASLTRLLPGLGQMESNRWKVFIPPPPKKTNKHIKPGSLTKSNSLHLPLVSPFKEHKTVKWAALTLELGAIKLCLGKTINPEK